MTTRIILATTSPVKVQAYWKSKLPQENLVHLAANTNTPQPVGDYGGLTVARQRIQRLLDRGHESYGATATDCIVAIESYLIEIDGVWYDKCVVVIQWNGYESVTFSADGNLVTTPQYRVDSWLDCSTPLTNSLGYDITLGDVIKRSVPSVEADDWYKMCNPFSREEYITGVLNTVDISGLIQAQIPRYPDYPKPGVNFLDFCGALADRVKHAFIRLLIAEFVQKNQHLLKHITHVVALDARGFILGSMVNEHIKGGLVMVRKQGKLPGDVIRATYMKEYGSDTFEIQQGVLPADANVLIVDDILATGGTVRAAYELVHACGVDTGPLIMVASIIPGFGPYPEHIARNLYTLY